MELNLGLNFGLKFEKESEVVFLLKLEFCVCINFDLKFDQILDSVSESEVVSPLKLELGSEYISECDCDSDFESTKSSSEKISLISNIRFLIYLS